MGVAPTQMIDQPAGSGNEPPRRPYRRRFFRDTPNGPVPYLPDGDPRHGTANGYNNCRCKCPDCTKAKSTEHAEYMARRRAAIKAGAA